MTPEPAVETPASLTASESRSTPGGGLRRLAPHAPVALPAALLAFLSFRAGGFFPDSPGLVALALLLFVLLRTTVAERPLEGVTLGVAVAAGALALFAGWTLLSALWSGASGRALLEYDRALMYALAVAAFGMLPRSGRRIAWATWLALAAIVVVCGAGLVTRLLPGLWHQPPTIAVDRLAFPLTYWNALGIVAALGLVLAAALTTSPRQPRAVQVLTAAAAPVLATTLLLTISRGAVAAVVVGLLVVVVAGRPEGWIGGGLALVAGCAAPVALVLSADVLTSIAFASDAGRSEGRHVAIAVGAGIAVAALVRLALGRVDRAMLARLDVARARPDAPRRRRLGWAAAIAAVVVAGVAVGAPGWLSRQVDTFAHQQYVQGEGSARLLDAAGNGRLEHWRVALRSFAAHPLHGTGAGTFETRWARERRNDMDVVDAHSLYLEVLGELGIVGLLLIACAIATLLWGFARLARGPDRAVGAALLAAGVAWALHAGIDWDWEMPATGLWLFALGGLALAAPAGRSRLRPPPRLARVLAGIGCLVLALTPLAVVRSEQQLSAAIDAWKAGDCATAIDRSLASLDALRSRPQPYELIGFCDVRLGYGDLALHNLRIATDRDPDFWQPWYDRALVEGAVGRDPRASARRAHELNPRSSLTRAAVAAFGRGGPRQWERRARTLPTP